MKQLLSIVAVSALLTGTAIAQQRMGPPQEAFAACSGNSSGDSCSFEGPRGSIDGTCGTIPENNSKMVCMPSQMGGNGMGNQGGSSNQIGGSGGSGGGMSDRRGSPPEAISACEGSSEGNSCSFTGRRGNQLSGTCRSHNEQLACAPDDGRPPMQ